MKTDKLRESSNIEDRRGQSGASFGNGGGSSGNLLFSLLFSRMGLKGKLILVLLLLVFGGSAGLSSIFTGQSNQNYYQSRQVETSGADVSDTDAEFVSKVLASTEDFWSETFTQNHLTYQAPKLVFYTDQTQTACGMGSAQAGPFYCSGDPKIYLDISFYQELSDKYKASGDFAMAYVIAHEVGHHIQNELGTMTSYATKRQKLSEKDANALNVRLELQADYYAGAWAKYVENQGLLDIGDIDEALNAAHAVGDDTLQEQAYGRSVPDSFTHGTSAQRKYWFKQGYKYGDLEHGDTFSQTNI